MEKQTQTLKPTQKHQLWDCESSLYDSYELKSFQRHLESAITARTMSMPRLSSASFRHKPLPLQPSDSDPPYKKHSSRLTRSVSKLVRSVFRPRHNHHNSTRDEAFYGYDTSSALSAIQEATDFDMFSPEMKALVRRTQSDRFMPASLGISCA